MAPTEGWILNVCRIRSARRSSRVANDGIQIVNGLFLWIVPVYRLYPLCPPGVVLEAEGGDKDEYVTFENLLNAEGRTTLAQEGMPERMMKSIYEYPCGHLVGSNYPDALRKVEPTDEFGNDMKFKIDLAAIDLFRDRERGIPAYNNVRHKLHLRPFKSWKAMTGDATSAKKLEIIYGPAPQGIEKCDLLVGDLYEKKIPGFAISETSFIIFLLMASRRLDADPFLNELYDKEHFTEFGLEHIASVDGLLHLLGRHYPDIAAPFIERKQSAFKPIYGPEKWKEAIDDGIVDPELVKQWETTKKENEQFFKTFKSYHV